VENALWLDGEMQSTPMGMPRCCNFGSDLGAGKHAAMAGFGALAELDLDHLDLRIGGVGDEFSSLNVPSALRQPK
jgi:hypothetical protein